jgi:L-histidine N-alpha-methyltransferase
MAAAPLLHSDFERPNFERKIIKSNRIDVFAEKKAFVTDSLAEDVEISLTAHPKYLLPKYFYDDSGSRLFEQITLTEEYYPTRSEQWILENYINELEEICTGINVISELGSGTSEKTKIILDNFTGKRKHLHYIPIDVSDILIEGSKNLIHEFNNISVTGIISEYEKGLSLLAQIEDHPKLLLFLGSSIGNFEDDEIITLMQNISDALYENDYVLIGFDLEKDEKILNRAYNDAAGITSAFNKNILHRINRELGADFDLNKFRHHAFFNARKHRVEMHLISIDNQFVHIGKLNRTISFCEGESIHTENSHKFSDKLINDYASQANLRIVKTWKDKNKYFALSLLAAK